jgi:hypothetical protein
LKAIDNFFVYSIGRSSPSVTSVWFNTIHVQMYGFVAFFFLYILYIFLIATCFLVYFYYSSAFIYYMSIERIENKGNGASRHLVVGLCTAVQFRRNSKSRLLLDIIFGFSRFQWCQSFWLVCDEFLFKLTILLYNFNNCVWQFYFDLLSYLK